MMKMTLLRINLILVVLLRNKIVRHLLNLVVNVLPILVKVVVNSLLKNLINLLNIIVSLPYNNNRINKKLSKNLPVLPIPVLILPVLTNLAKTLPNRQMILLVNII